jgi:hypothetical protein
LRWAQRGEVIAIPSQPTSWVCCLVSVIPATMGGHR